MNDLKEQDICNALLFVKIWHGPHDGQLSLELHKIWKKLSESTPTIQKDLAALELMNNGKIEKLNQNNQINSRVLKSGQGLVDKFRTLNWNAIMLDYEHLFKNALLQTI